MRLLLCKRMTFIFGKREVEFDKMQRRFSLGGWTLLYGKSVLWRHKSIY